jgi:tetratricopeptide (TPR) repeat protein
MLYTFRLLYWLLGWLYYALLLGAIGGAIAFFTFSAGYISVALGAALVTVALIIILLVSRFRELSQVLALASVFRRYPNSTAPDRRSSTQLDPYRQQYAQQYVKDLPSLERATETAPNDANAWASLAFALNIVGRLDEALAASEHALALDPRHASAWARKAGALVNLARFEEGLAACERALALSRDDASAWRNKGYALQRLGRPEEALTAYDRALALDPDNSSTWPVVTVWHGKAIALHQLGRYKEAVEEYERVLAAQPRLARGWFNKAISLHALGREKEAWTAARHAIKLIPNPGTSRRRTLRRNAM